MKRFDKLCEENYVRIYNYIYAMICDSPRAQDLTQEVFLLALKKGRTFLQHENHTAFLYKAAKIKVLESFRKEKKECMEELSEDIFDEEGDILSIIIKERDRTIDESKFLPQVLSQLNEEQKELYRYRYVEGQSIKQIAQKKGINQAALKMRYVRLRKDVKRVVKELNLGGGELI